MSFFSKILSKLGLAKPEAPAVAAAASKPAAPATPAAAPKPAAPATPAAAPKPAAAHFEERDEERRGAPTAPKPAPISEVDVVAKIEQMAQGSGLNWKTSIVDLLKILDLDSSKEARIELAKELNCPPELIGGDYSKMNVWLHKEVLRRIAQNGGNIPKELLD